MYKFCNVCKFYKGNYTTPSESKCSYFGKDSLVSCVDFRSPLFYGDCGPDGDYWVEMKHDEN